jgi:uncharacterized protein Yka (UPF0111/DUF47 family)
MKESPVVEDISEKSKKIAIMLVNKLKPTERYGKQIQVGRVRKLFVGETQKQGISIDERKADEIAENILSELSKEVFFSRDKPESKNFYSKLDAWKARRKKG